MCFISQRMLDQEEIQKSELFSKFAFMQLHVSKERIQCLKLHDKNDKNGRFFFFFYLCKVNQDNIFLEMHCLDHLMGTQAVIPYHVKRKEKSMTGRILFSLKFSYFTYLFCLKICSLNLNGGINTLQF